MAEVIGIDHIYIAVSDVSTAERFYDVVMSALEFRKNEFSFSGERHVQYYNRHFGYVLRPPRARLMPRMIPMGSGLHHFCLRVAGLEELRAVSETLRLAGVAVTEPAHYPQYAADYYAIYLIDPDGIRLEITNYREERRQRHDEWTRPEPLANMQSGGKQGDSENCCN